MSSSIDAWPYRLLPDDAYDDEAIVRIEDAYHEADEASVAAQRTYRRILAALAAASTVVAFTFLFYDAYGILAGLMLCGLALIAEVVLSRRAKRLDCHRTFIEQRVLAEALRVQAVLRYAGSDLHVGDLLTWSQLEETGWVRDRLEAIMAGAGSAPEPHDIRACWIEDQHGYHAKAIGRTARDVERSSRIVHVAMVASAALYVSLIVFELTVGGLPSTEPWRVALKFLMGGTSAATVFIANFYDKISLGRVYSDHIKMERFFARALDELDEHGQTDAVLERIAREELIENGNWYSYQLEGTPDIAL